MPAGPSSSKRFNTTFKTVNNLSCEVSIYDKLYNSSSNYFKIDRQAGGLTFNYNTDEKNVFNPIDTASVKISLKISDAAMLSFFNDLTTADEGRFYLEIKQGGVLFIGKIIVEEMELPDMPEPPFTITAIDGLTDLKAIDYVHPFNWTIKDIIISCLNKLDTIYLYGSTEKLLVCQSNILADVTFSMTEPFKTIRVEDYFYKFENDIKKPLSCYDVLSELCKRLFCKLSYSGGSYNFFGCEGIFDARVGSYIYYNKTGGVVSGTSPANSVQAIDNFALYGGAYRWQSPFNKIIYNTSKEFSNKFYGDGVIKEIYYPFLNSHAYLEIGVVLSSEKYVFKIKNELNALIYTGDRPDDFKIKYTIKQTVLSTGVTTEKDYFFTYAFAKNTYENSIDIDAVTGDRKIEVKAVFDSFYPAKTYSISNIANKISYILTKSKETDKVNFTAYVPNKNVKIKQVDILASDRYGKDLTKFFFHNDSFFDIRQQVEEGWKLSTSDSYKGLESSIVTYMLKYLRLTQKYYRVAINYKAGVSIDFYRKYSYKGENYVLVSYSLNLLDDIANAVFLKINTANIADIINVEDVPAVNGNTSNASGGIIANENTEYNFNYTVTGNTFTIDPSTQFKFPSVGIEQIRPNVKIFVNGIRQFIILTNSLDESKPNTIYLNITTGVVALPITLANALVVVEIKNRFKEEITF